MPTTDEYLAAAWAAAPAFDLDAKAITVLSHSENVVCEVNLGGDDRVAMRLHRPGYNTLDELNSEVQWVASLGRAGVPVPEPVPAVSGGHYSSMAIGGVPHHVGVVRWVEGMPLGAPTQAGGSDVVRHYVRIGELAAQIRIHNESWTPPAGFTRRRWDATGFVGDAPLWGRFWEVAALSSQQRMLFSDARTVIGDQLAALSTGGERFGLIHSDLHLGNLMTDGDSLTIIDFDDAGYGWFAHELAVALHPVLEEPWYRDARRAIVEGYRHVYPLTDEEESSIDLFLTMRCLMLVGWLDARRELPIYNQFEELAAEAEAFATVFMDSAGG